MPRKGSINRNAFLGNPPYPARCQCFRCNAGVIQKLNRCRTGIPTGAIPIFQFLYGNAPAIGVENLNTIFSIRNPVPVGKENTRISSGYLLSVYTLSYAALFIFGGGSILVFAQCFWVVERNKWAIVLCIILNYCGYSLRSHLLPHCTIKSGAHVPNRNITHNSIPFCLQDLCFFGW